MGILNVTSSAENRRAGRGKWGRNLGRNYLRVIGCGDLSAAICQASVPQCGPFSSDVQVLVELNVTEKRELEGECERNEGKEGKKREIY